MDWNCLACVVAQGSAWQFKGWPFKGGEAEIFSKACGFFFRFTHERPNQTAKGWHLNNLVFSVEKTRKHEVDALMVSFWDSLHKFIASKKPFLLAKPKRDVIDQIEHFVA